MSNLKSDDYYEVLGLSKGCTEADIKKAYRKLALKWHPDRHNSKGEEEKTKSEDNFKTVSEAYEILSDKDKRQKYDQFGKAAFENGGGGGGHFHFSNANDLFRQFFGGSGGGGNPFEELFGGGGGGGFGPGPGIRMRFGQQGGGGGGFGGFGGGDPFGGGGMRFGGHGHGHGMGGMRGGGRRRRPPTDPTTRMPPNTKVRITGLRSAAMYNDKTGTIKEFDFERERYVVIVQDDEEEETIRIKPSNLRNEPVVRLTGLSANYLNEKQGVILSYLPDKERYNIQVEGKRMALKPDNVRVPNGCAVKIDGLNGAQKWNNKWGTIMEFDEEAGRYVIQITDQQQLRVRPPNIRFE